jgi:hypothetical protein
MGHALQNDTICALCALPPNLQNKNKHHVRAAKALASASARAAIGDCRQGPPV